MASPTTSPDYFDFSDSEPVIDWNSCRSFALPFGKYRGETLGVLVRTKKTREYLRWLLTWEEIREETEAQIRCVLEHYDAVKAARVVVDEEK
jgi:hypothetical protein